jgi:four helix bundle protein
VRTVIAIRGDVENEEGGEMATIEGRRQSTNPNAGFRFHLEQRTRDFAVGVIRFVSALPEGQIRDVVGKQLFRSATSLGANCRAVARARSKPDFISKISIAEEEADETQYWLEILRDLKVVSENDFRQLYQEARELTAIFVSSGKTAKYGAAAVQLPRIESSDSL